MFETKQERLRLWRLVRVPFIAGFLAIVGSDVVDYLPGLTRMAAPVVCPDGTFKFQHAHGNLRVAMLDFSCIGADGRSTDITNLTDAVLCVEVFLALLPILWLAFKLFPNLDRMDE